MGTQDLGLTEWREHIGRALLNMDFRSLSPAPFQGTIKPILNHQSVRIVQQALTPGVTYRDKDLVKSCEGSMAIVYSPVCGMHFEQGGRNGQLSVGQATILRNHEIGEVGFSRRVKLIGIVVPTQVVEETGLLLDDLVARAWSKQSASFALLKGYVALLAKSPPLNPRETAAAARHVLDLFKLAAEAEAEVTPDAEEPAVTSVEQVRLRLAIDDIQRRFMYPGLSLASVAAAQGISVRLLQRIFERAGVQFTSLVNELRLNEAHSRLQDAGSREMTVLAIALAAGFSDASHFNRMFRRRFGTTPTGVRQRALL